MKMTKQIIRVCKPSALDLHAMRPRGASPCERLPRRLLCAQRRAKQGKIPYSFEAHNARQSQRPNRPPAGRWSYSPPPLLEYNALADSARIPQLARIPALARQLMNCEDHGGNQERQQIINAQIAPQWFSLFRSPDWPTYEAIKKNG